MTKRFGFTLAEVLITLTIIGVIAAMTIPTLMSNTSDQEFKTGFKKAISTINQAITMQYALEGTDMSNYTSTGTTGIFNADYGVANAVFQQRMQVVDTTTGRTTGKAYGATNAAGNAAIYLSDGMVIEFPSGNMDGSAGAKTCTNGDYKYDAGSNPTGCLYTVVVDVNGDKGTCQVATETTYSNGKVRAKDCFPVNIHADGARPANFVGREIMYGGK